MKKKLLAYFSEFEILIQDAIVEFRVVGMRSRI